LSSAEGFELKQIGPYELLLALARGGMAAVYLARRTGAAGFERLVIVKRVHPHLASSEARSMLRDEARITSFIRHPNVVGVTDVVEDGDELLLVLDYVESLALSELWRAAGTGGAVLAPSIVSRIMSDVLAGLHAAHEVTDLEGNPLDVIHRDISPQNVIVGVDGTSRLIDFGVAKARARLSSTESGSLKGKLSYMSPEQITQKPLDRRADVFAAGVVLFELFTGRRLFTGDAEGDIAMGILFAQIPRPSSLVPGLPPEVDAVLDKALARDRDARFPTARAMLEALEAALPPAPAREVAELVEREGEGKLASRRNALREAAAAEAAPRTDDSSTQLPDRPRPARTRSFVIGFVALAVMVALVTWWKIGPSRERSAVHPAPESAPPAAEVLSSPPRSSAAGAVAAGVVEPSAEQPRAPAATHPSKRVTPRVRNAPTVLHESPYGGH
jgi:serine/threonine protein kinase